MLPSPIKAIKLNARGFSDTTTHILSSLAKRIGKTKKKSSQQNSFTKNRVSQGGGVAILIKK
jgi:hypothetical protein